MKTVLQELKEKLQGKVNSPMSMQIECDIFQRVVDVIDDVYFEKEKQQITDAYRHGKNIGYENTDNYYKETFGDKFK